MPSVQVGMSGEAVFVSDDPKMTSLRMAQYGVNPPIRTA